MTLAGAQDRPSRAGTMVGKMMGAMKAARASEPHPETHSHILVTGAKSPFRRADEGGLARSTFFSLFWHLHFTWGLRRWRTGG